MKLKPWKKTDGSTPLTSMITPFTEEFDNLFNFWDGGSTKEFLNRLPQAFRASRFPPIDIAESKTSVTVRVEFAGMEEDDFDVEFLGDQLVISGERKWEEEKDENEYHRIESQYGTFRRVIGLPPGLKKDVDSVVATYKKGILEIVIPKLEPTPASKITVRRG